MANDDLRRRFLDNIKNPSIEFYSFFTSYLQEYFDSCNKKFKFFNGLTESRYDDFNLFNINKIEDIREHDGIETYKNGICDRRARTDDGLTVKTLVSCYGSSSLYLISENFFYKDFYITFCYKPFDFLKFRNVTKENIYYYWYDSLVKLIPNIYKKLGFLIMEKLGIDNSKYYIKFDKLFSTESIEKLTSGYSEKIKDMNYKYEPFLVFSIADPYNIETGDIKVKYNQYNNIQFRTYYRSDTHGVGILPFKNILVSRPISSKSSTSFIEAKALDYGYSHFPTFNEFIIDEENDLFKEKTTENKEINLTNILPIGYGSNKLIIGNIFNYLYCTIIERETNKQLIIQFNHYGIKPSIVYNASSMKAISVYNKNNIMSYASVEDIEERTRLEDLIDSKILSFKTFLSNKIDSWNRIMFDKYMKILLNEIENDTMYKEGLIPDHIYQECKSEFGEEIAKRVYSLGFRIFLTDDFLNNRCMIPNRKSKSMIPSSKNNIFQFNCASVAIRKPITPEITKHLDSYHIYDKDKKVNIFWPSLDELKLYSNYEEWREICKNHFRFSNLLTIKFGIDSIPFRLNDIETIRKDILDEYKYAWYFSNLKNSESNIVLTRSKCDEITNQYNSSNSYIYSYINNQSKDSYPPNSYKAFDKFLQIAYLIKPIAETLINQIFIPEFIELCNTNKDLKEAYELSLKVSEINKKIQTEKKNKYSNYTTDSISQFAQEASYFDSELKIYSRHLTTLFKTIDK